jgi:hypothetical protein
MGKFLESEKKRQTVFKLNSPYFSEGARSDGVYKVKPRPFCLPLTHAEENLFPGIRGSAPSYFETSGIKWHDGQAGKPSNHLCDSQVCCVNFLFPLADQPIALAEVLRSVFPDIHRMLPIENGLYVAFEWIGQKNYLGERVPRSGRRTRGANCTSADAAVMFERTDGKRQIVLIEWKYTESYGGVSLKVASSGTDRTEIYRWLFERDDCPIDKSFFESFDRLFYEPFYQFMRQQLLASQMEVSRELTADVVSVLHIAPNQNTDFRRITSPDLQPLGATATEVWERLVRCPGRFMSVSTEEIFGRLSLEQLPTMGEWVDYIGERYPWVSSDGWKT